MIIFEFVSCHGFSDSNGWNTSCFMHNITVSIFHDRKTLPYSTNRVRCLLWTFLDTCRELVVSTAGFA